MPHPLSSVDQEASEECLIKFADEIFRIETKECPDQQVDEGETRMKKPDCDHCKVWTCTCILVFS